MGPTMAGAAWLVALAGRLRRVRRASRAERSSAGGAWGKGHAMAGSSVRVRRVYDEPERSDGIRVLVDRIWPRGLTKAKAALDEWCKDIAPSTELRKWYSHDPDRFDDFGRRYRAELKDPQRAEALAHLRGLAKDHQLTLLTATRDAKISEAAVLADVLHS
jgi:uncharacterized protein YeaO (DUF488 family)